MQQPPVTAAALQKQKNRQTIATKSSTTIFDVLLTVHLSIILAINQLKEQNLLL